MTDRIDEIRNRREAAPKKINIWGDVLSCDVSAQPFICCAPADIDYLVAEVERLQNELEDVKRAWVDQRAM